MHKYLILQNPGHNRVYYNLADKLAMSELQLAGTVTEVDLVDPKIELIAGVRYLSFETQDELNKSDLLILSSLSFVFAFFKVGGTKGLIQPIERITNEYVDQKISSMLKYPGKTNELFTKMMINVAVLSSDFSNNESLLLLDPVAGKGTTLHEALVYGYSAYGIELESKSVQDGVSFFKKYLESERYKHVSDKHQVFGKSKSEAVYLHSFGFAKSKDEFKDEENRKWLGLVNGNTNDAGSYFRKNTFHLLVGDLPYGIAHGNTAAQRHKSITRNPSEMIKECSPAWFKVLKPGGALVLAWNSHLVSRKRMQDLLGQAGFEVKIESPYDKFEHAVDRAIRRDLVVAIKR